MPEKEIKMYTVQFVNDRRLDFTASGYRAWEDRLELFDDKGEVFATFRMVHVSGWWTGYIGLKS